jgi:hypothetical protein
VVNQGVDNKTYEGLDPVMAGQLARLRAAAAAEGITTNITSGYRDKVTQAALVANQRATRAGTPLPYPDLGPVHVAAAPGHSPHNFGVAADLSSSNPARLDQLARAFGLTPGSQFGDPGHYQLGGNYVADHLARAAQPDYQMASAAGPDVSPSTLFAGAGTPASLSSAYANPTPISPASAAINALAPTSGGLNAPTPPQGGWPMPPPRPPGLSLANPNVPAGQPVSMTIPSPSGQFQTPGTSLNTTANDPLLARIVAGEAATPKGQQAVLSVMRNRAANNFAGADAGLSGIATARNQFEAYPDKLGTPKPFTYDLINQANAGTLNDNTNGALYYVAAGNPGMNKGVGDSPVNIGGNVFSDRFGTPSAGYLAGTNVPPGGIGPSGLGPGSGGRGGGAEVQLPQPPITTAGQGPAIPGVTGPIDPEQITRGGPAGMSPGQTPTKPNIGGALSGIGAGLSQMGGGDQQAPQLPSPPPMPPPPLPRGIGPATAALGMGMTGSPQQQSLTQQALTGAPGVSALAPGSAQTPFGWSAAPPGAGSAMPGAPGAAGIAPLYAASPGGAPGTSLSGLNAQMQEQLYQLMLQQQMSGMA